MDDLFNKLFKHYNWSLLKLKSNIYVCQCNNKLREKYYIFLICSDDYDISIGSIVFAHSMNNIKCIQFRSFKEPLTNTNIPKHSIPFDNSFVKKYTITKNNTQKDKSKNQKISEYRMVVNEFKYIVQLFHTTDSDYEYNNNGILLSAIITWNTMITMFDGDEKEQEQQSADVVLQQKQVIDPNLINYQKNTKSVII